MRSEALKKAQATYEAKIKSYHFRCDPVADKDVIDRIESMPNKNEYLKELVRKDIRGQ